MSDAETVRVKIECPFCHGAKEPDGQPVDCEACHEFGWDFGTLAEPDAATYRLGLAALEEYRHDVEEPVVLYPAGAEAEEAEFQRHKAWQTEMNRLLDVSERLAAAALAAQPGAPR